MKQTILRFDTEGAVHGLYTEAILLQTIGRLSVKRASVIEFDEASQQWEVRTLQDKLLFRSPSRQSCLDWEMEYFTR